MLFRGDIVKVLHGYDTGQWGEVCGVGENTCFINLIIASAGYQHITELPTDYLEKVVAFRIGDQVVATHEDNSDFGETGPSGHQVGIVKSVYHEAARVYYPDFSGTRTSQEQSYTFDYRHIHVCDDLNFTLGDQVRHTETERIYTLTEIWKLGPSQYLYHVAGNSRNTDVFLESKLEPYVTNDPEPYREPDRFRSLDIE
jgi:hypothetical protein